MDEKDVKGILSELKRRRTEARNKIIDEISDAELKHQYNGKWGLYMLFKCGYSLATPNNSAVFDKSMVIDAIKKFKEGDHSIRFPCGEKVSMEHLDLIIPMPVKG